MLNRLLFAFLGSIFFVCTAFSQNDSYRIEVEIEGFDNDTLMLGYYLFDKQYLTDTATVNTDGKFVFEGDEPLNPGLYLVVLPPDNNFFQILVDTVDQHFFVKNEKADLFGGLSFEGSKENTLFLEYMRFIAEQRPEADELRTKIEAAKGKEKEKLQVKLAKVDERVKAYQQELKDQHGKSLTNAIVQATQPVTPPDDFAEDDEERNLKIFRWHQKHAFDGIDLADPRMLRTPFFYQRINTFVEKLTVQVPDSINQSIDRVLTLMEPSEKNYRQFLGHFLNKYAATKIVGFDAVYVHLAEAYYGGGKAPWTDEETKKSIVENAAKLKPTLIGKIAPNIIMQRRDDSKIALHDVESPFTIVYFWRPDCGHCKKAAPDLVKFGKDYKSKGVEIFTICVKFMDDVPGCWDMIDEKEFGGFINTVDPYHRSKFHDLYDVRQTPKIFVLDENKKIISKSIGIEQLPEVMDRMIEMKENETQKSK